MMANGAVSNCRLLRRYDAWCKILVLDVLFIESGVWRQWASVVELTIGNLGIVMMRGRSSIERKQTSAHTPH